jgi:putative transposase
VQRLTDVMGLSPMYPKLRRSMGNKQHTIYPYLLRNLVLDRQIQVCA